MSAHATEQLSAYLDDELVPAERAGVEAHLRECAECARRLEDLAAVDDLARGLPAEAPAGYFEDFAARVRDRVESKPATRARFRLPVWALAAAAALAVGVTVPLLLRQGKLESPAERDQRQVAEAVSAAPAPAAPPPAAQAAPMEAPSSSLDELQTRRAEREDKPAKARQKEYAEPHGVDGVAGRFESAPSDRADKVSPEQEQEKRDVDEKLKALGYVADSSLQKKQESDAAPAFVPAPAEAGRMAANEAAGAAAAAPPAAAAPKRALAERKDTALAAGGGVDRFRELLNRSAGTLAEARALRDAWRVHATMTTGTEADEARVRVVETGAQAYRLGRDPVDLALLEKDAESYLARPDALQAARVRALVNATRVLAP